jgi:hypothetical protein
MPDLSRRHLVTTAAALPALAVPAAAETLNHELDPIFAAIEKERALTAAFNARCHYEDDLARSGHTLTPAPDETYQTPEMVAVVSASRAARAELANTAPTTLAGMVAYLDYVVSESDKLDELLFEDYAAGGNDEARDFVRSLARGARQMQRLAAVA